MKASLAWIEEFADLGLPADRVAEGMTMSGTKVEGIERSGEGLSGIVAGRILDVGRHPGADRLVLCRMDIGGPAGREPLRIVTGAPNVIAGQMVPVALDGAVLADGTVIRSGRIRGEASQGMLCSIQELGLPEEDYDEEIRKGILVLPGDTIPGTDIRKVLGLEDVVLDFEVTSNRPDCLSVEGLAREAAVTFDRPFRPVAPLVTESGDGDARDHIRIRIDAPDLCQRYVGRVVTDVAVGPSPDWMVRRLRSAGIRSLGNLVDITNYVMLELGHPLHAFDLSLVRGAEIRVRRAETGERLMTLDGVERDLDPSVLVIADAEGPVALAGIMGGEHSGIFPTTRTVLLEAACFSGIPLRQTARRMGLRTESSARFEKGLDPDNARRAIDRAAELVERLGCGRVVPGRVDVYPGKPVPRRIPFRPGRIRAFLGAEIADDFMLDTFRRLGCRIEPHDGGLAVVPPGYRQDLEGEADLAEEAARFHGYGRIPPTLHAGSTATLGGRTARQAWIERIKDLFAAQGFYEMATYSFESPREGERLGFPEGHPMRNPLRIRNPLGEEYSAMRLSMFPSLLRVAALNAARSVERVAGFEIGHVYRPVPPEAGAPSQERLPDEAPTLGAVLYEAAGGEDGERLFFRMKGVLERLLDMLGIRDAVFLPETGHPALHPGRAARLEKDGKTWAVLGAVHPAIAASYEVPEGTLLLEADLALLLAAADRTRRHRPLPRYPSISRDLALLLDRDVPAATVADTIRTAAGPLLESLELFDVYQGAQVPADRKSMAYRLVFRSPDRTLQDEEIQRAMQDVLDRTAAAFHAVRR